MNSNFIFAMTATKLFAEVLTTRDSLTANTNNPLWVFQFNSCYGECLNYWLVSGSPLKWHWLIKLISIKNLIPMFLHLQCDGKIISIFFKSFIQIYLLLDQSAEANKYGDCTSAEE